MTLGCKVNQYETEAMETLFRDKGYASVKEGEIADVYVINTCTVTNLGDKKSRQFIRRARRQNKNAIVAVVGCYSQVAPDEIMKIEGVNLVIGTDERSKIVDFVEDLEPWDLVCHVGDIMKVREFEELSIDQVTDKTRAFIKIQEGCNQYCSYCIIPYARGPIRSRQPENVIKEVTRLVENGFKEIVLTGIHIASYGKDLGGIHLIDIIEQVSQIKGLDRIRLGSLEPRLMTDDFIQRLTALTNFCPHFHLSLQSGSDTVLQRMNRKYSTAEYLTIVEKLKKHFDRPSITTDIIVGFPGETDSEFEETFNFVNAVGFAKIHVFQFSPKTGTPAAKMPGQVLSDVKHRRSERLIEEANRLELAYYNSFLGDTQSVLLESDLLSKEGYLEGLTPTYIRVAVPKGTHQEGEMIHVKLQTIEGDLMMGVTVTL